MAMRQCTQKPTWSMKDFESERENCYQPSPPPDECSRREVGTLASKSGKPIKRYASGKFLPTYARRPVRVSSDSCDRFDESSSFGLLCLGLVPRWTGHLGSIRPIGFMGCRPFAQLRQVAWNITATRSKCQWSPDPRRANSSYRFATSCHPIAATGSRPDSSTYPAFAPPP